MATNPNRRNARGVWKLKDIQSFKQDGEYPNGAAIGIFAGGSSPNTNVIDFIQTASTGNAADFGDLTEGKYLMSACTSDSHGGLG